MPNSKPWPDDAEELDKARADLQNAQSRAATEPAQKGHASSEVAATLQRTRNVTEEAD
jgi:hypothetical protein